MLHDAPVLALAFSRDSELLASGDQQGRVKVWRVRTGQCLRRFDSAHSQGVTSLAFSRDGTQVLSSSYDTLVRCAPGCWVAVERSGAGFSRVTGGGQCERLGSWLQSFGSFTLIPIRDQSMLLPAGSHKAHTSQPPLLPPPPAACLLSPAGCMASRAARC